MFQDMQIPVLPRLDGDYLPRSEAAVLGAKNLLYRTLDETKSINTSGTWNNNVYTFKGITFTINSDDTVTVNGNNDGTGQSYLSLRIPSDVYGDLYFSGCPSGVSGSAHIFSYDMVTNVRPTKWDGVTASDSDLGETSQEIKVINGHATDIRIRVLSGGSVNNKIFKPMVRLGTDLDDTYALPAKTNRDLAIEVTNMYPKEIIMDAITATSISGAIGAVWDAINIRGHVVTGTFQYSGRYMFIAYKYPSNPYGMMIVQKYSQNDVYTLSVDNGTKVVKKLAATAVS